MENYFTDNFVDYDDPPIDNSSLSGDNHEFSLTSPNSDSTGLYPSSYSPPATNYQATEQPVFDIMGYYNSEQPDIQNQTGPLIPEKSKRGGRKKAQPAETPVKTESQNDSSSEDKILEKSKRIQKREIAKERTKQKTDLATLFQGVDVKFLPEGYDDPNLDERTKKKMIQMVRNRISAQNSRDRKKGYMTQLEEQNAQLEANYAALKEERDLLASQLEAAQNELEILRNRGTASCSNCLRTEKEEDFLVTNNGDDNNLLNDIPAGGFSGLSSPRLVRFASSRTSLFGMFAFTCFIGMIALSGMGQQDALGMQGSGLKEVRRLEVDQALASSSVIENKDYINLQIPDYSKSLMIQNINQIMAQFEKSYEPTFKSHLEKSSIFNNVSLQESMKVIEKVIEPEVEKEVKNGLVQYGSAKLPRFRKNVAPAIINTPPALNNDPLTSTLFCHSGQEFYGNENVQYSNKGELARNNSLDLEKAEYLQLLVPKGTITRSNVNNRFNDIYGQTLYNEEKSDDDTMLEIWCKVFMVREMGTSY